jgi:hypothetical protein
VRLRRSYRLARAETQSSGRDSRRRSSCSSARRATHSFPKPPVAWPSCSASKSHARPGRIFRISTIPANSRRPSSRFFGASVHEPSVAVWLCGREAPFVARAVVHVRSPDTIGKDEREERSCEVSRRPLQPEIARATRRESPHPTIVLSRRRGLCGSALGSGELGGPGRPDALAVTTLDASRA